MEENTIIAIPKEPNSQLKIGAFTFTREHTGHIVLSVDVDSGLFPLRLTHEQTGILTQWMHTISKDTAWS